MTYLLSPLAVIDIEDILTYLDQRNPAVALRYRDDFYSAFSKLADNPYHGQAQPDISKNARHWVISPYRILYRIVDPDIEIVRVIHAARDITQQDF